MGKRKKFKGFEGYDYMELARKWKLKIGDNEVDHEALVEYIRENLWRTDESGNPTQEMVNAADDIRLFCEALYKDGYSGYLKGLWKAVSKIEDDFTLFQAFTKLLPMAWN